jgi:hypothetical protein
MPNDKNIANFYGLTYFPKNGKISSRITVGGLMGGLLFANGIFNKSQENAKVFEKYEDWVNIAIIRYMMWGTHISNESQYYDMISYHIIKTRDELLEIVFELWDMEELKKINKKKNKMMKWVQNSKKFKTSECPICLDEKQCGLLFECSHSHCLDCFQNLREIKCSICRQKNTNKTGKKILLQN